MHVINYYYHNNSYPFKLITIIIHIPVNGNPGLVLFQKKVGIYLITKAHVDNQFDFYVYSSIVLGCIISPDQPELIKYIPLASHIIILV